MQIINQGRVSFEYKIGEEEPIISETKCSNRVITFVLDNRIKIEKKVDKGIVSLFDIITYTIFINNISQLTIENLFFKDLLSENIRFLMNSACVNGIKRRCVNPNKGFEIGGINPGEQITISFRAVVLSKGACSEIENFGAVEYDYIYNLELSPVKVTTETNKVVTGVKDNLFKQWTHQILLEVPWEDTCIGTMQKCKAFIRPIEGKVVTTKYGCKVVAIGEICYEVFYISAEGKEVFKYSYKEWFSCLIKVPDSIIYCEINHIKGIVEDAEISLINENRVLLSSQILVQLD